MAGIIYEVLDLATGNWTEYRDNDLALAGPKGIGGLSVQLENAGGRGIGYQAFFNNKWAPAVNDGQRLGDNTNPFYAVRLLLSFRRGHHVTYRALDVNFKSFTGSDNQIAGDVDQNGNLGANAQVLAALQIGYV